MINYYTGSKCNSLQESNKDELIRTMGVKLAEAEQQLIQLSQQVNCTVLGSVHGRIIILHKSLS